MQKFRGKIGEYRLIPTEDQSHTLWSEAYDENCHSTAGAYRETLYNFVEGCQLMERTKAEQGLRVLEVGFGLGIGLKATLESLAEAQLPLEGLFVSTEIDPALIEWAKEYTPIQNHCGFQYSDLKLVQQDKFEYYFYKQNSLTIIVLIGDARKMLPTAAKDLELNNFTSIFQDAFSPKKNPVLWSVEWFTLLKELSAKEVLLSTYSASSSVRKSLHLAGWNVQKRVGFGPKRSATTASLQGETDPEILRNIKSPKVPAIIDQEILPTGQKSKS